MTRRVVAMGGGWFSMEPENPLFAPLDCRPGDAAVARTVGDLESFVLEHDVTDSFGLEQLAPLHDGLGLLPGSACPHYDGEDQRRPAFTRLVAAGELVDGWAADDGAALVFAGTELEEVVASRPHAGAYRVERTAGDGVNERRLPTRYSE